MQRSFWLRLSAVTVVTAVLPLSAQNPSPTPAAAQSVASWEEQMKLGRLPYHQLTVADFPIKSSPAGQDDCYVQTFMDPRYDGFLYFNRGWVHGYMKNFRVFSGLNQAASYRRKGFEKMDDYLPVAQAILDLNEIRVRELGMIPPDGWPEYRGGAEAEVKAGLEARVKALCQAKFDQAQGDIDQLLKATDQETKRRPGR